MSKARGQKKIAPKGARRKERFRQKRLTTATLSEWNELVLPENIYSSPNYNSRRPSSKVPTHIVVHITGTDNFDAVMERFLRPNSVSAHYLVTPSGEIFQFVKDGGRAYHAGIDSNTRKLYERGFAVWSRYLKYFEWYKGYPVDAVYLDGDGQPVWDKSEAIFVVNFNGTTWSHFAYFTNRWPGMEIPVNFDSDPDPNNYSTSNLRFNTWRRTDCCQRESEA
jgi:hypothetical protein